MEKPQEKFTPSPEQIIETNLGKGTVEVIGDVTRSLFSDMKARLAEIGIENGTNKERKEKMLKYLDMWIWFSNALFARTQSENVKSPEVVKIAMDGATALMQAEIEQKGREAATTMIEALKKRYDIK